MCSLNLKPGLRISFYSTSEEEAYEGLIVKIEEHRRISLKNCTIKESGIILKGVATFFFTDLEDIVVLDPQNAPPMEADKEELQTPSAVVSRNMEPRFRTSSGRNQPEHLGKLCTLDLPSVIGPASKVVSTETSNEIPSPVMDPSLSYDDSSLEIEVIREFLWENGSPILSFVPSSYVLIESHSSRIYEEAIDELLTQRMLGLSLEGQCLGRDGVGSLLCISSPNHKVYIFDILEKCEEYFEGLRSILTSPSIVKVVHDCRMLSDYLDKVLQIRPNNIYDTLGAHLSFLTWAVHKGHVINYAVSVAYCVRNYLGVGKESIYYPKYRREYMEKDTSFWLQRPLLQSCKEYAIKNVMYLLDLYIILQEAVSLPAVRATKALLSVVRDKDLPDYYSNMHLMDRLPLSVMNQLPKWEECRENTIQSSHGVAQGIRIHQYISNSDSSVIFSKHIMHMKKSS